jgi:hypothetical protein
VWESTTRMVSGTCASVANGAANRAAVVGAGSTPAAVDW